MSDGNILEALAKHLAELLVPYVAAALHLLEVGYHGLRVAENVTFTNLEVWRSSCGLSAGSEALIPGWHDAGVLDHQDHTPPRRSRPVDDSLGHDEALLRPEGDRAIF